MEATVCVHTPKIQGENLLDRCIQNLKIHTTLLLKFSLLQGIKYLEGVIMHNIIKL